MKRSCTATTRRRRMWSSSSTQAAIGDLRLVRSSFSFGIDDEAKRPSGQWASTVGAFDGCRLLLASARLGCWPAEPTRVTGEQVLGGGGVGRRVRRGRCGSAFRCWPNSTPGWYSRPATSWRSVGRPRRVVPRRPPGTCREPGDRATPRRPSWSGSNLSQSTPTCSRPRTSHGPSGAKRGRCWDARDALGQARAIRALYESAESGRAVEVGDG